MMGSIRRSRSSSPPVNVRAATTNGTLDKDGTNHWNSAAGDGSTGSSNSPTTPQFGDDRRQVDHRYFRPTRGLGDEPVSAVEDAFHVATATFSTSFRKD